MKKSVLLLLLAIFSATLGLSAADIYRVTSQSVLNVRNAPSKQGAVVSTLAPGARIEVMSVSGGWAKIRLSNGSTAYCSADYLAYVGESTQKVEKEKKNSGYAMPAFLRSIAESTQGWGLSRNVLMVLALIGALVGCITFFVQQEDMDFGDGSYWTSAIGLTVASVCEILFFIASTDSISLTDNGWIAAIAGFIVMGAMAYSQALTCLGLVYVAEADYRFNSIKGDLVAIMTGVTAVWMLVMVGASIFDWDLPVWLSIIILLLPVAMAVMLAFQGFNDDEGGAGIAVALVYLLTVYGTMMLVVSFVVIAIIVVIAIVVIGFILAALGSGSNGESHTFYDSDGNKWRITIRR